mgnify:CR=1 FL=1
MKRYTKTKTFRISEAQLKTLQKMKSYNVDVGRFIREAIKEKLDKEYSYIIEKKNGFFIKENNLRFYSNHGVNWSFSLGKCDSHRTHLSFVLFSPFLLFLPFIFLFSFRRNVIGVIVFSYTT